VYTFKDAQAFLQVCGVVSGFDRYKLSKATTKYIYVRIINKEKKKKKKKKKKRKEEIREKRREKIMRREEKGG
jgi:hypothetical protein